MTLSTSTILRTLLFPMIVAAIIGASADVPNRPYPGPRPELRPPAPPPAPADDEVAPQKADNGMRVVKVACATCGRTGRLQLHPPDHGQHNGSINSKDHWDVKCACPVCNGKGRRSVYRLRTKPIDAIPPCRSCGWSGVERCRKCQATGLVKCPGHECRGGWIIKKNETSNGKYNRHFKMTVDPCPECGGLGKIVCPECRGMEGSPCRVCNGLGKKVK